MNTKQCFKCLENKPLDSFYKHSGMADGRVNKCKDCNKKDVRENRAKNIEYYREYDRKRGNRQTKEDLHQYRANNPRKHAAHQAVQSAVKAGVLVPQPCEICSETGNVHAHHDDYAKQLDVRWLCPIHHKAWHKKHGEGLNG